MYLQYFGLRDKPFSITPDPAFVYMSPRHQEALGHLLYGTGEDGGFVQLTGEVGTGKTTLIRTLLMQEMPTLDIALILNPRLTAVEFLQSVCDELHAPYPREALTLKPLVDALNAHLLRSHAEGRRTVLIVDEAQNLPRDLLEQIRLLTNLETHKEKLLRIMLVGQPELRELLRREDLRQLAQRITARCHLEPLGRAEVKTYITHRIQVAGGHPDLFTAAALRAVWWVTRGVPRLINIVCDRALLGAYSQNLRRVDRKTLLKAADEALAGTLFRNVHGRYYPWMWSGAVLAAVLIGAGVFWIQRPVPPAAAAPAAAASTLPGAVAGVAAVQPPSFPAVFPDTSPEAAVSPEAPVVPPADDAIEAESAPPPPRYARLTAGLPALAADWGVPTPEGSDLNCSQVARKGLRCLNGRGNWSELISYNLPALIRLEDGIVLLRSLRGERAEIETPEGIESLSLKAIRTAFVGEYLMLWRAPLKDDTIGGASDGEAVAWLDRQLRSFEGARAQEYPVPQRFDELMVERVQRFQRSRGLKADGQVGPRTLILLAQLSADKTQPRLREH